MRLHSNGAYILSCRHYGLEFRTSLEGSKSRGWRTVLLLKTCLLSVQIRSVIKGTRDIFSQSRRLQILTELPGKSYFMFGETEA